VPQKGAPPPELPESLAVVGLSGTEFRLAAESAPPLERALANRDVTRAYLLDIIATVRAKYPPEIFPTQLVQALGEALRALPVPWLREFAYAGMLATLQSLEDEEASGSRVDRQQNDHPSGDVEWGGSEAH
jgi:hypothetical protein